MTILAAAFLAVSISSPRIGTFFDLNGMVPDSVPADRTFGSDAATNATHRLDSQEQAAVNACFEAYYERVYYANAGLSNVWDEVSYGPQCRGGTGLENFRLKTLAFDGSADFWYVYGGADPNGYYVPDTNRVVDTRRFVEYNNIRRLCKALMPEYSLYLDLHRPSWRRGYYYGSEIIPLWSSTLFDGLTLEHGQPEVFPVIDWMDKRSFLMHGGSQKDPYFWMNVHLCWDYVPRRDDDPVNWGSGSRRCWLEDALWYLSFGDPPDMNDMAHEGYFLETDYALTNSTMDIVGRGYAVTNITTTVVSNITTAVTNVTRHVGLEGLTNETRRLVSDNLVGLGLGLSALDRTYCDVVHAIPTVVSNWNGYASRDYDASLNVPVSFEWNGSAWTATTTMNIDVPTLVEDRTTSRKYPFDASLGDDYICYADPAGMSFQIGSTVTNVLPNVLWDVENFEFMLGDQFRRLADEGSGSVWILFYTGSAVGFGGGGEIRFQGLIGDGDSPTPEPYEYFDVSVGDARDFLPTNVTLLVNASAGTSYQFGHTFSRDGKLARREGCMPYPGGGYSLIDNGSPPSLWTVFSRGAVAGTDLDHEWRKRGDVYYSRGRDGYYLQQYDYASRVDTFQSLSQAWTCSDDSYTYLVESCRDLFSDLTSGLVFDDPVSILDYVSSGIAQAMTLENIVFGSGSSFALTISTPFSYDETWGILFDIDAAGHVQDMVAYNEFGPMGPPPYIAFSFDTTISKDNTTVKDGHYPSSNDFHGCGVAGRMTSLTKVNWKWNALKLERTNQ